MSASLNRVEFVIQKYRLGELTFIDSEQNGQKLGHGQVLADDALNQFMAGDPSGNYKYMDWMLFQAGGGQDTMEKSLQLWDGENATDPNSLRNQCRADFLQEQVAGYTDEQGIRHAPIAKEEAEAAWKRWEERSKFEFIMGDQDVASEEGYGFYRHWPGKDNHYQKIVNAVKLWHMAQPKLLAQNQRRQRWITLTQIPAGTWTKDDRAFIQKCQDTPPPVEVVLDIYSGWKPNEYSQAGAIYKSLNDLLRTVADVRKMQILRDVRFDKVYEDYAVLALCPLTIGASIKFGINKWCVSNRSEFDRSFDGHSGLDGNWQRYNKQGPLVFLCWKIAMPPWLHKIAIHVHNEHLRSLNGRWDDVNWIDCQNQQTATSYMSVSDRIFSEHEGALKRDRLGQLTPVIQNDPIVPGVFVQGLSSDERYYQWGGREPGPAWDCADAGRNVMASLKEVLIAVRKWGRTFDTNRVILDYVTDVGSALEV